jgi:hypothetical protein
LSKQQAELLCFSVKGCNLVHQYNKKCFFRNRQNEFEELFSQENDLIFCIGVCCFLEDLGHQNDPNEWLLFINSSKVLLKAVLLHNGNKFPSVPPAHLANLQDMKLFRKRSSIKNIIGIFVRN